MAPSTHLAAGARGLGDFVTRSGLVDHVYEVDKSNSKAWAETAAALRARSWGLILSPHQSPRTLLLVRSLKAQRKIGYRSFFSSFVFTTTIKRPMARPEVLRQLALLLEFDPSLEAVFNQYGEQALRQQETAGVHATHLPTVPASADMSLLHFTEARLRWSLDKTATSLTPRIQDLIGHEKIDGKKRVALLAPGSVWNTKRWTVNGYAETARALLTDNWRVLLIGAPNEKDLCADIAAQAPGALTVAGPLSLWESAELMAIADLVIANDSGAMHMASLAGTPTVSVFGPTVLAQGYRPWQTRAVVVEAELPCRPCGKHGAERCPLGTHACMKQISSRVVLAAAQSLVG